MEGEREKHWFKNCFICSEKSSILIPSKNLHLCKSHFFQLENKLIKEGITELVIIDDDFEVPEKWHEEKSYNIHGHGVE